MTEEITAKFDKLMKQALMTADVYMGEAVERIDRQFGGGFARKNPGLVGTFMQVAALDFGFAVLAQQLRAGLESVAENIPDTEPIADALNEIADNMSDPDINEPLHRVADKLSLVAYGLCDGAEGDPADSVPNALRSAARIIAGSSD